MPCFKGNESGTWKKNIFIIYLKKKSKVESQF